MNDVIAIVCYSTALFPQVLHLQNQVRLLDNITCGPDYFTNWSFQGWVGCWVTLYYLTVTSTFTCLLGSEVFTQGWIVLHGTTCNHLPLCHTFNKTKHRMPMVYSIIGLRP